MALTRLCGFCYEPLAECVCPDVDEPKPATEPPIEEDVLYRIGGDGMQAMASGLTVRHTAADGAQTIAERKLGILRRAVQRVLDDEESGESGWGPDVTMLTVLREAMEASA